MKRTAAILERLRTYESQNVTCIEADGSWPIVWTRARGCHVWDAEGRKYLDLTAAFGVAATGHANPRVVRAGQRQMARLLHAMGDVHPHPLKARLACELSRITFERWARPVRAPAGHSGDGSIKGRTVRRLGDSAPTPPTARAAGRGKTIFTNSGFEAVEAALKTALLATGRPGVIAFAGAYHGLGYGALTTTQRSFFRSPFRAQLREFAVFVPFPADTDALDRLTTQVDRVLRRGRTGAILVEPVQGRGGIRVPPFEFLARLRRLCDARGALLIVDEIFTGFGRTGRWFACEHGGVIPDLICLGKALTGGFPLSACVGRADLMDAAWPRSRGEALHTSTFLGHPVGCAMALAQIAEIRRLRLVQVSARLGAGLLRRLGELHPLDRRLRCDARGLGLMVGLEVCAGDGSPAGEASLRIIKTMLRRGYVLLPEGEHGNVISFTPPLTIGESDLRATVGVLAEVLGQQ